MIQREREMEGDEFKDKEAFVTQAYKDQMAEVRRAEEEERQREGMSQFVAIRKPKLIACCRGGKEEEDRQHRDTYGVDVHHDRRLHRYVVLGFPYGGGNVTDECGIQGACLWDTRT